MDFICKKDGEIPLTRIVEEILDGATISKIGASGIANIISFNKATGEIVEGPTSKSKVRLEDIPSPYLTGLMDKFFVSDRQTLSPFIETNRGCPFTCTFCHTSDSYYNKPQWTTAEKLRKELEMLGRHFRDRHEVRLFMADNNFGSFKEDIETASLIRETQEKYNWPRYIDVTTGKTRPDRIVQTISKLRWGMIATASLQTLTPHVLKRIERKNLNFDDFIALQQGTAKEGSRSQTELIMSLPGETRETFLDTIRQVFDAGIEQITVYTLMNLKGTPMYDLHRDSSADYIIRHRIVPRQFGEYGGKKIFDTEEVVVGTPTFSFDDYIDVRGLSSVIQLIYNGSLIPELIMFLRERECCLFDWVSRIYQLALADPGVAGQQLSEFLRETKEELWDSHEEIEKTFSSPERYAGLVSGEVGRNLLSKYAFVGRFEGFDAWMELALKSAEEMLLSRAPDEKSQRRDTGVLNALRTYFFATRDLKVLMAKCSEKDSNIDIALNLDYDIGEWVKNRQTRKLEEYYQPSSTFFATYSNSQKENLARLSRLNKNEQEVKIQFLLRGYTEDLWPVCKERQSAS